MFELLDATKEGSVPVPEAANPILGFELVQLNVVVPVVFEVVKLTGVVESPLHTI